MKRLVVALMIFVPACIYSNDPSESTTGNISDELLKKYLCRCNEQEILRAKLYADIYTDALLGHEHKMLEKLLDEGYPVDGALVSLIQQKVSSLDEQLFDRLEKKSTVSWLRISNPEWFVDDALKNEEMRAKVVKCYRAKEKKNHL